MPATNPLLILSRQAAAALAGGRAVTFANAYPTQVGARVLGVVRAASAANGEFFAVVVAGTALVEAGAAIPDGAELIADTEGCAIPATGVAGERVFADAMQPATATGQYVQALLRR